MAARAVKVSMANQAAAGTLPVCPKEPKEKIAQYSIIPRAARLTGMPHLCPLRMPDPPMIIASAVRNSAMSKKMVSKGFST